LSITINNPSVENKIRKLADRTGESLDVAIELAVDERLARLPPVRGYVDREKIRKLLEYFDSLPLDDPRSTDEILGYNENGVPD
jgi:antitoxin VapB